MSLLSFWNQCSLGTNTRTGFLTFYIYFNLKICPNAEQQLVDRKPAFTKVSCIIIVTQKFRDSISYGSALISCNPKGKYPSYSGPQFAHL